MGFNYAREKKKFDSEWEKKEKWYRESGMSEDAIQEMFEEDWKTFKADRIYYLHNTVSLTDSLAEHIPCDDTYEETFVPDDCGLINAINSPEMVRELRRLSKDDIQIMELRMKGKTQGEIAAIMKCTQPNIAKKIRRIKKILKKFW